jgi:hypothetical protein
VRDAQNLWALRFIAGTQQREHHQYDQFLHVVDSYLHTPWKLEQLKDCRHRKCRTSKFTVKPASLRKEAGEAG